MNDKIIIRYDSNFIDTKIYNLFIICKKLLKREYVYFQKSDNKNVIWFLFKNFKKYTLIIHIDWKKHEKFSHLNIAKFQND